MSWNYRVFGYKDNDEFYFRIHEVYYNKKGIPISHSVQGANIGGNSLNELSQVMTKMAESFSRPIIDGNRFPRLWDSALKNKTQKIIDLNNGLIAIPVKKTKKKKL